MAGQLGLRARNLVGGFGFLRSNDTQESSSPSQRRRKNTNNTSRLSIIHSQSSEQEEIYASYVNANERLGATKTKTGYDSCQHQFQESLKEFNIDHNDASGMKVLVRLLITY